MGLYDRPYYQDEPQRPFMQLSGTRSMIVNLIIINIAIWVIDVFVAPMNLIVSQMDCQTGASPR